MHAFAPLVEATPGDGVGLATGYQSGEVDQRVTRLEFQHAVAAAWWGGATMPIGLDDSDTRWSTAHNQGLAYAVYRAPLPGRATLAVTAGARFNAGDAGRYPHLLTGSHLGVLAESAPAARSLAVSVAFERFLPLSDGSLPGSLWYLRLERRHRFDWRGLQARTAVGLDAEYLNAGADADGSRLADDGSTWFAAARAGIARRGWSASVSTQVALSERAPDGEGADLRVGFGVRYGFD